MKITDEIITKIKNTYSFLVLAWDPDGLLLGEEVTRYINMENYLFIEYEDPLLFRYQYELKYRTPRDEGGDIYRILVRTEEDPGEVLPYDVLKKGEILYLSLSEIFPKLDIGVLRNLTPEQQGKLYDIYSKYMGEPLGKNSTVNFVLKNVFKTDPQMINNTEDLFIYLLKRHHREEPYPQTIDNCLLTMMRKNHLFDHIPLENILSNRWYFFKYIEDEWEKFFSESEKNPEIPFGNQEIKIYTKSLIEEKLINADEPAKEIDKNKIMSLWEKAKDKMPDESSHYSQWNKFALIWGDFIKTFYESSHFLDQNLIQSVEEFHDKLENCFARWMEKNYSLLINLPYLPEPVMVHHIPRFLSYRLKKEQKIALIVMDGMAIDQWLIVRDTLRKNRDIILMENRIFAWVPTLTSVSRQAIFSGHTPSMFPNSIHTTYQEEKLWKRFWENDGLQKNKIGFMPNLKLTDKKLPTDDITENSKVMGMVINIIDEMGHGEKTGMNSLYERIRYWIDRENFTEFIKRLITQNFTIFVTSDHGNIYAEGIGSVEEKKLAEFGGERVRIFNQKELRKKAMLTKGGIILKNTGLPDNYYPLFAPVRSSFTTRGEKTISHGGISIEEVIVPFVEIRSNV